MAAQEQAMALEPQSCKVCRGAPETIQHIEKKMQACTMKDTKWLGKCILYRRICATYGLEFPMSQWETPTKVVENKMRSRRISSSNWYWKEDPSCDRQTDY